MTVTVKITGLKDLEKQLDNLSKAAGKGAVRRSMMRAAKPLVALAKSQAPVRTGKLQGSIGVGATLNGRQTKLHRRLFRDASASVELFVGPSYLSADGGRHGHLLEFGTMKMPPQPFMRPAWDQDKMNMLERLKEELWLQIQKAVARAEARAARG